MGSRESRCRRGALLGSAIGLASSGVLAISPPPTLAATQSLQVQAGPNPQATRPLAVSATGQVGVPSTITIYAQPGSSGCVAQAAEEAGRGGMLVDQRMVAGSFSFSVTFTPAAAGPYFVCTYLDGAAAGSVEHQNQAFAISVAPAPPPPATTPPASPPAGSAPATVPGRACVVPALKRHTLRGAAHLLAAGHCRLGRVYLPSAAALRAARRRAAGRPPTLVVVSQTPAAGAVRIAGYTVAVRLAFGRAPRTSTRRPTP